MNSYSSLRRRSSGILIPVVALALCVVLSASVLLGRLIGYNASVEQQMIPLTVSNGVTQVTTVERGNAHAVGGPKLLRLSAGPAVMPMAETQPQQTQGGTQWLTITELELFKVSYENGEGQVTVQSSNGDKIVAPGTSNSYTFSLQNTSDMGLDYDIEVEAYFTIEGGDQNVPVQLRLWDQNGNYLIGSPDDYEDLSDVNVAEGEGSVSAGYIVPYTIEWQWPFEGDDVFDTSLGSYFVETEAAVSFVMEIRTTAEQGGEGGQPPQTGDIGIGGATVALVASATGLLIIPLIPKRKREETDDR